MQGRRAVELASGHLREVRDEQFAKPMTEMLDFCQGLVGVDFQSVIHGLGEATSTLTVLITLKTRFFGRPSPGHWPAYCTGTRASLHNARRAALIIGNGNR